MKTSRDFILLGSFIGLLAAAAVLYWSHHDVGRLVSASAASARSHATRRALLDETTVKLARLKAELLDVQRGDRVPPTYDEWSRQQAETRATLTWLREHFAAFEPTLAGPVAPQPAFTAAAQKIRRLGATLVADWHDYEQRGSGLTPASREYATATLLPLLAREIQPTLENLAATEMADAEHEAAASPALIRPAQRIRLLAAVALVACFGLLAYTFAPRRPKTEKLLSAAMEKRSAPSPTPPVAKNFDHNVAAMDPSMPKILVAEHNAADSDTLSLLLTNAGFAVIGCDNGRVAREAIQRIPFALLLLDLHLPEEGGLEILKAARQHHPHLPAILICDPRENADGMESSGPFITQIVRRPLNPRTLLWSVSEILYPGENREPREYSPNLPDSDDEPPPVSETGEPVVIEPPPAPPAQPPEISRPALRVSKPEPVVTPPLPAAPVERPTPPAPAAPPPPANPVVDASPAVASPPEPFPAAAPTAESPSTVIDPAAPASATPESDPSSASPAVPRKKMVRRKILPDSET